MQDTRRPRPPARDITLFVLAFLAAVWSAVATGPALAADLSGTFAVYTKGSTETVDHSAWDKLLAAYVEPDASGVNRVAYARFKAAGMPALQTYIASLEAVDVKTLDRPEQFAFWANLYNAKTIAIVLDKYPVMSIKDISLCGGLIAVVTGGPWKAKVLKVSGVGLSLDDIEHGILRPVFLDPRVHYAVNCASFGCPNLAVEALTGAKLETQLDAGARAYVNSPRGISVSDGGVTASSIYSWFQDDFGATEAGVLSHVRKYADAALKQELEGISAISDYRYDWNLNDAGLNHAGK